MTKSSGQIVIIIYRSLTHSFRLWYTMKWVFIICKVTLIPDLISSFIGESGNKVNPDVSLGFAECQRAKDLANAVAFK